MNKTFRSVWNASKQTYVATAEIVRCGGRPCASSVSTATAACLLAVLPALSAHAQTAPPAATALPTGGSVSAGQASISGSGTAGLLIQQTTDRAAINWQTFNVGKDAQVTFQQPGASSVTLNRVLSNDPSQILGRVSANGQVILTNPSGVYFGKDARVDVGGLVATTHSISDADFMAGVNRFERNGSTGSVVNDGTLQTSLGGYVALLAPEVRNQGVIVAQAGTVALASGEAIDLHFDSQSRLTSLRVEPGLLATLVENRHAVQAPGGLVILSAQSLDRLQGSVVRNLGQIEATGLQQGPGGRILLSAGGVENAGSITASGAQGGQISLNGDRVALQDGSRMDASGAQGGGTVRVGGGWQGSADPLLQLAGQAASEATTVTMAAGAVIDASATTQGAGGTVVLWSGLDKAEGLTSAQGTVRVNGGVLGGNGGQVETSGHSVAIDGFRVDALAPQGQAGLWLIDPYDYTIGTTQAATIASALNSASVTVTTASNTTSYGSAGVSTANGDITVTAPITKTGATETTLTLQAARHINVASGADITSTTGKLDLQLTADTALNGAGIVQMGGNIATNGGWVRFGNNQSITIAGASTRIGGDVFFNGASAQTLNTAGGQLDVYGEVLLSNTSGLSINTGAGNATFYGVLNSGDAYSFVQRTSGGTWDTARTEAKGSTAGASAIGDTYLVNITSRLENAVAGIASGYRGAWIGAYRPNSNAYAWTWADGPESGQQFFTQTAGGGGSAAAGGYQNFGAGEPNGGLNATRTNVETVGQFFGNVGQWNDLVHTTTYSASQASQYAVLGFVRETNLASSPLTITSTGNVTFNQAVGTSKTLGNLAVTGNQVTFNGALRVDATGATITNANTGLISGAVSGTGSLTKSGAGTLTLKSNGSYTGATQISSGMLVLQNNAPTTASSGFSGTGVLHIEPTANSFTSAFSTSGWTLGSSLSGLTLGKSTNTANVTVAGAVSIAGPIEVDGGNVAINGALTATGSNAITLKGSGSVTQTAALTASKLLLLGGNATLNNAGNNVDTLAASGVGSLAYTDSNALTLGTVGSTDGVSATGAVNIGTGSGNLTVAKNVTTTNATASALVLNADIAKAAGDSTGGNLIFSGAPTVSVGAGGTGKLLSGSVAGSTGLTTLVGSGSGRFRYNSDEASTNYTTALSTGLDAIYRESPSVSVTTDAKAMTYGDNLPLLTGNVTGGAVVNGDTPHYAVAVVANQKSTSGNYKAGSHTIVDDTLAGLGYQVSTTSGTLTVAQRDVNLTGLGITDKTYDKTDAASVSAYGTLSGKIAADALTLNSSGASAAFADVNAGANKAVTVSGLALSGADAANYHINNQSATATISPRTLTLAAVTDTKVYDATTASAGTVGTTGLVGGDTVSGLQQTFDSKNVQGSGGSTLTVGNGYTVSDGNSGDNYTVVRSTAAGTITPKALTTSGLSSADKAYDATTIATVSGTATLQASGAAGTGTSGDGKAYTGDTVSLAGTASGAFNTKDVATATTVSFSGVRLAGADAGNYTLTQQAPVAQVITPASLTVTAVDDAKLFGESDPANFLGVTYSGFKGSDIASSLTGTLNISRANPGNTNAGTYNNDLTASGLSSNNYAITFQPGTFTIVPADTLLVRLANATTTYGAATPDYVLTGARYLAGDNVTIVDLMDPGAASISRTGNQVTFQDNFGYSGITGVSLTVPTNGNLSTGGNLRVGGYAINGNVTAGFGNFQNLVVVGAHQVNAAGVTASANAGISKTYDGTTAMTGLSMALAGQVGGDVLTIDGNGAFNTKNAGTGNRSYTVTDLTLGNTDAGNYYLTQGDSFTGTNGTITPLQLNVTYTGVNKVYDGNVAATVTTTDNRIVGDNLAISSTATFANKNAATGKTVTVTGASLSGADVGNYTLASTSGSTTADISRATLVISGIVGAETTYNGTTTAALNTSGLIKTGLVTNDDVTVAVSGSYANANAGDNKAITLTSTHGGADEDNYVITDQTGTSASVLRRQVAVSASGVSKTYDGTTAMNAITIGLGAVGGVAESGVVNGETVTVSGSGSFDSVDAGSGKSYTLSGLALDGANADNYILAGGAATVTGNNGVIQQKTLTLANLSASDKAYDGTSGATLLNAGNLSGVVGSDVVSFSSGGASFADKNVGTGKTVTVSGIALGGAGAGNYTIATQATTTADLTPKVLTISGTTVDGKTYDGTTSATVGNWGSVSTGVGSEALVLNNGTAAFADKTAGGGKAVNVTGYSLADGSGGGLASNYQLASSSVAATASIARAAVSVTGMTAQSRAYDGTTAATLSGGQLSGVVNGDTVTFLGQSGAFADKNAANGKAVSVTGLTLDGVDAGNYTVSQPTGVTGNITPKVLTVSGLSAIGKVYDGTLAADVAQWGSVSTGVGGETLTLNHGSAEFADKNAGIGKTVTASGYHLADGSGGGLASNYQLSSSNATTTADIAARAITVSGITVQGKVYDGNTVATLVGGALSGLAMGDVVSFSGQSGSFADKDAGTAKAVTVSGLTLSGADASNYAVAQPTGLQATIAPRAVTVTADAQQKRSLQDDPAWTYQVEAQTGTRGLLSGESLGGALTRTPGEAAGEYPILQGTVNAASNPNYAINYIGADLKVTSATATPQAPAAPAAPLPAAAAAAPGSVAGSAGIAVVLTTAPTAAQQGTVSVSVPKEMATAGAGFSFPLPPAMLDAASGQKEVVVTTLQGATLPGWLTFNPQSLVFTASAVPDGAFPMQVLVIVGDVRSVIVISERETAQAAPR